MFGHHDDPVYGHTWSYEKGRSDALETAGSLPAMFSWDLGGIENGDSLNLDGVPFRLIRKNAIELNRNGGVNTFSWHLRNPINNNDSWTFSDTTIVRQMMENPESFRRQLTNLAGFFNSLVDENGRKEPVVFRPWHEHTGGWFFWGTPNTTEQQYQFLWDETRRVLDEQGVDNVVWAYSPDRVTGKDQYMARYPGDDLVDIVGIDIYHFDKKGGLEEYRKTVETGLATVTGLAKEHGKIPAFTETGLESITMPDWYTDVLLPMLKENEVAYVVVWRNAHDNPKHYYVPFKEHPAEKSFVTFTSYPKILMLRDMKPCGNCGSDKKCD